jgi:hypothetical protein
MNMSSEVHEMNLEDKVDMLTAQLEASKKAQEYSHENLMILERDRQKAWDENKSLRFDNDEIKQTQKRYEDQNVRLIKEKDELKKQACCTYDHTSLMNVCTKCGWMR